MELVLAREYQGSLFAFRHLVQQCELLGEKYKPSDNRLAIDSLRSLEESIIATFKDYKMLHKTIGEKLNERTVLNKKVKEVVRQLLQSIQPTEKDEKFPPLLPAQDRISRPLPEDLLLKREIRRIVWLPYIRETVQSSTDTSKQEVKIKRLSDSEWHDLQANMLAELVEKLSLSPLYSPNEGRNTLEEVGNLTVEIRSNSEEIKRHHQEEKDLQHRLRELFYNPDSGVVAVADAVKRYVSAEVNIEEEAAKIIGVIMFRNVEVESKLEK